MTIQAHTHDARDLRVAARQGLLPARGAGWLAGFGNMLAKELGEWFRTRRWLWQIMIWLIVIDGFAAFSLFILPWMASILPSIEPTMETATGGLPRELAAPFWYFSLVVMNGTIGVIILAQDEVIQEKQMGTAAWTLSKPVARPAFILTKLLSNMAGALIFIVALPGLVVLGEGYLAVHQVPPLLPFLAGAGLAWLALIFYISLVIMLGVLCESRMAVLGISFGAMFGGVLFTNLFPQIAFATPFSMDKIATIVGLGQPLPAIGVAGIIVTAASSILFILVALWRFQRVEL